MSRLKKLQRATVTRARRHWYKFLSRRPLELMQALRTCYGTSKTNLATLDPSRVPSRIAGFHDLSYLFANHQANRGIIAQDIDEASYLWKVVVDSEPGQILEIGRWLGGSTILLCSAAALYGGSVISVDSKVLAPEYAQDSLLDRNLTALGLSNYQLAIHDSATFDPGAQIDLAFIDGDHTYDGVKADFDNVRRHLAPNAQLLFHDSCASRLFASRHEGVARLMEEIQAATEFRLIGEVGSISHWKLIAQ